MVWFLIFIKSLLSGTFSLDALYLGTNVKNYSLKIDDYEDILTLDQFETRDKKTFLILKTDSHS